MNIEVKSMKPDISVALRMTAVSMEQISAVTTEGYAKLMELLAREGKGIAGAPYLAYMNGNADFSQFDVELGIPVAEPVSAQGEFFMSKNCEGKAICAMYKGAYKEIDAAYIALMDYAKENSLESTGVYYDYYISNPADTPESELLTQVVFPIK